VTTETLVPIDHPESTAVTLPVGERRVPLGNDFYKTLFDNLYDGVYFVDSERKIRYWNRGAERIAGYSAGEMEGRSCFSSLLDHIDSRGCHLCLAHQCPLMHALKSGGTSCERVSLRHKDGRRIAVDIHVMPIHDGDGQVIGAVEVFRDATPVVALEAALAKLRDLAMKDPLTGLANRRHLDEMLDLRLSLFRSTGLPFSVLMVDLDHFKRINDTHGHAEGDRVLIRFGAIARAACRTDDIVGRFGGEEFLILLPEVGLDRARTVAERLRRSVASQMDATAPAGSGPVGLTISVGVTQAVQGETAEELLARADAAMYRAKAAGRDRVVAIPPGEPTAPERPSQLLGGYL
jgi:diguanylate cyclase (GGDEF)-like protein/PAS domain S-box-containing protein